MNAKYYVLSGIALVVALAACIIAAVVGSSAFKKINALSGARPTETVQIDEIQKQVLALDSRIADLTEKIDKMAGRYARLSQVTTTPDAAGPTPESLVALSDAMYHLEEIVDASGLKTIATNMAVDPSIMKDVYDEYYERKLISTHRDAMSEMNTAQHAADKERYGEPIEKLYETARARVGRGRQDDQDREAAEKAREQAFDELVSNYPDANATAMLIAERGMGSMFRGNTEEAEKYYQMLTDNPQRADVVTDWGMKAVPTMQYYLANQYIENGRVDEARAIIDQLQYSGEDMIFGGGGRGRRGGPRYQKTSDAVNELRRRLEDGE